MKIKSLLGSALLIALSTQAVALEITGGHLVRHKEWANQGSKGAFVLMHQSARHSLRAMQPVDQDLFSNVLSYANMSAMTGSVNTMVSISGNNMVWVMNNSNSMKLYQYFYATCVNISDKMQNCIYYNDYVELAPNGYFDDSHRPELQMTFATAGTYSTSSLARVTDGNNEVMSMSNADASITIS